MISDRPLLSFKSSILFGGIDRQYKPFTNDEVENVFEKYNCECRATPEAIMMYVYENNIEFEKKLNTGGKPFKKIQLNDIKQLKRLEKNNNVIFLFFYSEGTAMFIVFLIHDETDAQKCTNHIIRFCRSVEILSNKSRFKDSMSNAKIDDKYPDYVIAPMTKGKNPIYRGGSKSDSVTSTLSYISYAQDEEKHAEKSLTKIRKHASPQPNKYRSSSPEDNLSSNKSSTNFFSRYARPQNEQFSTYISYDKSLRNMKGNREQQVFHNISRRKFSTSDQSSTSS